MTHADLKTRLGDRAGPKQDSRESQKPSTSSATRDFDFNMARLGNPCELAFTKDHFPQSSLFERPLDDVFIIIHYLHIYD